MSNDKTAFNTIPYLSRPDPGFELYIKLWYTIKGMTQE